MPAGVTLDLTADGVKFELRDGAELTVDGTVNTSGHGDHGKGWVEGGLRIGDGATVINGSGTIRLNSKGCLLNIGSDRSKRHLTLDGVTLVGLEDNDNSLVQVNGGGELVLKSGAIMGNTITRNDSDSGDVKVSESGTFTIEGGEISGNSATAMGGGVHLWKGAFIMKGGTISNNSSGGAGGGVYVNTGSTFTMEGDTISGNIAEKGGGGVYVYRSAFTLKGGRIQGGTDSDVFAKNTGYHAIGYGDESVLKWGTGGTYTKGGAAQTGGSDICDKDDHSDETLITIPAK